MKQFFAVAMLVAATGCTSSIMESRSVKGGRAIKTNHYPHEITGVVEATPTSGGMAQIFFGARPLLIEQSDLELMVTQFRVDAVSELRGAYIASMSHDPLVALQNLVYVLRTGIKSIPDTKEQVYRQAAIALAKKQCPRYPEADLELIQSAYAEVFDEHLNGEKDWVTALATEIERLSGGGVRLVRAANPQSTALKKFRVDEPVAHLGILVEGDVGAFTLTPSPIPFDCTWTGTQYH